MLKTDDAASTSTKILLNNGNLKLATSSLRYSYSEVVEIHRAAHLEPIEESK